jgi:LysM repeat protein
VAIINRKNSIYTVRLGDTLFSIAQKFQSSVGEIMRVNHLYSPVTDTGLIFPGDVLIIPNLSEVGKVTYIIHPRDYTSRIASRFNTFIDLLAGINNLENPNLIFPDQRLTIPAFIYEIQVDDTLSSISRRFGIPILNISRANQGRPGFQEDLLWTGFYLIIPFNTSRNIVIWSPLPGTRGVNGQRIEGQGRAFEANVLHLLRDMNGVTVSNERFTTADIGAPAYGNFTSTLPFDRNPTANRGEILVYTRSAKDGSIQDLVRTLVYF